VQSFGYLGESKLALTQRVSTASTQPRKGQTPSASTVSKLKKAMSGQGGQEVHYGVTLRSKETRAPDGGAIADYPKGWRFLPNATHEQHEILKKIPKVAEAMKKLHNLSGVEQTRQYKRDAGAPYRLASSRASAYKIINDAHYELVIAPQIKAENERKVRAEEEQRQTIATLKMRVQELTQRPIFEPTAPAITTSPTSYLPLAVAGIVIVVILLFLRRRK